MRNQGVYGIVSSVHQKERPSKISITAPELIEIYSLNGLSVSAVNIVTWRNLYETTVS